jgi:cbb3-type cytochrome oxidase subunit 3
MAEPATATSANTAILYLVFIAVVFICQYMR